MNDLLESYLSAVLRENEKINLTNIRDHSVARILHLEDSLAALDELNRAPEGLYGDLGSGGGFPGVPLAIASGRTTMLIDSVKKKMAVVGSIVQEIGLDQQISLYDKRIEELAQEKPAAFSVLTARALSSLPSLLELASPLLKQDGQLICLKAHTDEELERARTIEAQTGMRFIAKRSFYLSDNKSYREIIVFEKSSTPTTKLPRRIGFAHNKPLK